MKDTPVHGIYISFDSLEVSYCLRDGKPQLLFRARPNRHDDALSVRRQAEDLLDIGLVFEGQLCTRLSNIVESIELGTLRDCVVMITKGQERCLLYYEREGTPLGNAKAMYSAINSMIMENENRSFATWEISDQFGMGWRPV